MPGFSPFQVLMTVRHTVLVFLERRRGIDIRTTLVIEDVHRDQSRNTSYMPVGNWFLRRVLNSLPITSRDAIFDFGCGKGGALVTFARYPFRRVGGIELSEELFAIARSNMERLGIRHAALFCGDAAEFTDLALDEYTYFYFFNPFSPRVMDPVMQNVLKSLARRPRPCTIIYANPVCHEVILSTGAFTVTKTFSSKHWQRYFIYEYTARMSPRLALPK